MLEYGVAVIITPIERFYNHMLSRFATSQNKRRFGQQAGYDSQNEVLSGLDYYQEAESDHESMAKNYADLAKEIKVIKQEMTKMKARMHWYANINVYVKEILLDNRKSCILVQSTKTRFKVQNIDMSQWKWLNVESNLAI